MVGEELYADSSQGLVGAGITQMNLQSHLCEAKRDKREIPLYIYIHIRMCRCVCEGSEGINDLKPGSIKITAV